MHKWRKVVSAILPACSLLQIDSKTTLILVTHEKLLMAKKGRKRLGLSFPAILACIQDCSLLTWNIIME